MAKAKKTKKITNVRLHELLGISVYTLTDWSKEPKDGEDNSRYKIYTILKSMSEDEIIERLNSIN